MFTSLTLHGGAGTILWGHREAVRLRSWRISQNQKSKQWTLKGTAERIDAFQSRQTPLLFSAPRDKGFWCWAIEKLDVDTFGLQVVARLGPPER